MELRMIDKVDGSGAGPVSDTRRKSVASWIEEEAERQRARHVLNISAELDTIRSMNAISYMRNVGLRNVSSAPAHVREYLRANDGQFGFRGDPGNIGHKLEVRQGNIEWDDVIDPCGIGAPLRYTARLRPYGPCHGQKVVVAIKRAALSAKRLWWIWISRTPLRTQG
jgi:hypothetical protein